MVAPCVGAPTNRCKWRCSDRREETLRPKGDIRNPNLATESQQGKNFPFFLKLQVVQNHKNEKNATSYAWKFTRREYEMPQTVVDGERNITSESTFCVFAICTEQSDMLSKQTTVFKVDSRVIQAAQTLYRPHLFVHYSSLLSVLVPLYTHLSTFKDVCVLWISHSTHLVFANWVKREVPWKGERCCIQMTKYIPGVRRIVH